MILSQRYKLLEKPSATKAMPHKSRAYKTILRENPDQIFKNSTSLSLKMERAFCSVLSNFRLSHSATLKMSSPSLLKWWGVVTKRACTETASDQGKKMPPARVFTMLLRGLIAKYSSSEFALIYSNTRT